ncbi:MAG: DUF4114 domain-containing protein, partial [Okeania sp. SIO3H1]|nr:DUF4114 domain-containing protein [Okeania sp. SIO3H1]
TNIALSQGNTLEFNTIGLIPGQVSSLDDLILNSGQLYAPFVTTFGADGDVTNFAYAEANPDSSTRIISLGTNYFGVEDGAIGLADNDFNDVVFRLNMTFANAPFPIV